MYCFLTSFLTLEILLLHLTFRLKKVSKVIVDPVGIPVLLARQARGVHLVFQAMHNQDYKERRAVKGDKASLELLVCPVDNFS